MFGVGQKTDLFRDLNLQPVALPFQPSFLRLDCGQLWQEPAIAGLDWLFTPNLRLEEHLLVEPLQASIRFYPYFTLPKDRSSGFGLHPSDCRHFHTLPLINCRLIAFASGTSCELPLPLRWTPWHVIRNVWYNSVEQYQAITIRFQVLLTSCHGYFSTFHRCTICYRTQIVFKVRNWCLLNSHSVSSE